jgi:arginyl-tRNA synthetase
MEQLAQQVDGMSLGAMAEQYPNCHPELNPFDFYRAHLSNILAGITGVEPKIIYPALSWTSSLDKGDLILAAPALRVKGQKPDELVKQWAEKVRAQDPRPNPR